LKIMFAVSFAIIVVLRPPLFAVNVVSKSPCLQFYCSLFAVRYTYNQLPTKM
jgi:hypothetical protein